MVTKVIIYARVSKQTENIQHPENQIRQLRDYCTVKDYQIFEPPFIERKAGWKTLKDRIVFAQALDTLEKEDIQRMVLIRTDRMIRADEVKMEVNNFIARNPTKFIESIDGGVWGENVFMDDINVAMNKEEIRKLKARIIAGRIEHLKEVEFNGRIKKVSDKTGRYDGRQPYMAKDPITGKYTKFIDPAIVLSARNNEGLSMQAIAIRLGCSVKLVWGILKDDGQKRVVELRKNIQVLKNDIKDIDRIDGNLTLLANKPIKKKGFEEDE